MNPPPAPSDVGSGRTPVWWRVATTPLGDLARGRITGPIARTSRARHGWPQRVRAAGLPVPVSDLILRVVARTRLWCREKEDVARELIAHFRDGLEAGGGADGGAELIRSFGDPRLAARLIRRAKRRNRPLIWQVWRRGCQAAGLLLLLAAVAYAWYGAHYWLRRPRIARNYAAELNAPILARPEADKAWSLYMRAIATMEVTPRELERHWGVYRPGDPEWPAVVAYVERSGGTLDLIRDGASRPVLGLVLCDEIPADFDAAVRARARRAGGPGWEPLPPGSDNPALIGIVLPHLSEMRGFARLLSADLHAALDAGDADRAGRDLRAVSGLADQVCESPFLISDLVGLAIFNVAMADVGEALRDHADRLPDDLLVGLAHTLSSFRGGGDLRPDLAGERVFFEDLVQRVYTDDGRGDGRVTAAGTRFLGRFFEDRRADWLDELGASPALGPIQAAAAPSRLEITDEYDRRMAALHASYDRPLWEWSEKRPEVMFRRRHRERYRVLHWALPDVRRVFAAGESAAQRRDGLLAAIAIELYRRRHGDWPASFAALVPGWLPAVPRDRYGSGPLRFMIRDGRPVIYSIGYDRDDDGGRPAAEPRPIGYERVSVAEHGGPLTEDRARRDDDGDWILWPLPAREPLDRDEPDADTGAGPG